MNKYYNLCHIFYSALAKSGCVARGGGGRSGLKYTDMILMLDGIRLRWNPETTIIFSTGPAHVAIQIGNPQHIPHLVPCNDLYLIGFCIRCAGFVLNFLSLISETNRWFFRIFAFFASFRFQIFVPLRKKRQNFALFASDFLFHFVFISSFYFRYKLNWSKKSQCLFQRLCLWPCSGPYTCLCQSFLSISVHHVHFHATCTCPYCMPMSILHLYVLAVFHVRAFILHVYAARPCGMTMLHVYIACHCYISMLQVHVTCPCCKSMLHVHSACPYLHAICMSMLHKHAALRSYST